MTDNQRITFFAGEIDALFVAFCALMDASDARSQMPELLTTMMQARQAKHEGQSNPPVPEVLLDGFQDMRDRILHYAKSERGSN